MSTTASRIQMLRKGFNLSQNEFAKNIGVSIDTVSSWERGLKKPTGERLSKIARYFFVSEDYILCKTDSRSMDKDLNRNTEFTDAASKEQLIDNIKVYFDMLEKESIVKTFDYVRSLFRER